MDFTCSAGMPFSALDAHLRAAIGRIYHNFDLTVDIGQIRAMENTHGFANGWHIHQHRVLFIDEHIIGDNINDAEIAAFEEWFHERCRAPSEPPLCAYCDGELYVAARAITERDSAVAWALAHAARYVD